MFLILAIAAAPAAHAQTVGTFETLASSANPLTAETVDPTTNLIYAQQNEGTAWYRYNPRTDTWTQLASSPLNSGNNGGAAYLNGKIYTVFTENDTDIGVYDIATDSWTTIPLPSQVADVDSTGPGAITAVGDLLYIAVGKSFISLNPVSGTVTTLAAPPDMPGCYISGYTSWGTLVPYNGKIYGTQGNDCSGMAVYDIAANTWTTLSSAPDGVAMGGAIDAVTGTYYAYGPYGGSNWYSYNIATDTWTTPPATSPFTSQGDGGMAYIGTPGIQGIYAIEGEGGIGFTRFVTPAPSADVSVTKTASASSVTVGANVTYTIKATNAGPDAAFGTVVTDTLPSQVSLVSSSSTQGSCSGTTTVTCNVGLLASGSSATVTITVKTNAVGTATDKASVSTTSNDTNTANNSASLSTVINAVPPAPKPKPKTLRLTISSHSAVVGTHKCFAFKATHSGKGVGGVTVTLGGKKTHTSNQGKAKICLTFTKKGAHRASASKKGYATAHATVHVKPKVAKKPVVFTG